MAAISIYEFDNETQRSRRCEDHVLRITRFVEFSDDRRSITVEIDLQPDHRHQLTLASQFRDDEGRALEPYLIDITTGEVEP